MAGRTVLDLSVKRTKEEPIRAWFVLRRGGGLALGVIRCRVDAARTGPLDRGRVRVGRIDS